VGSSERSSDCWRGIMVPHSRACPQTPASCVGTWDKSLCLADGRVTGWSMLPAITVRWEVAVPPLHPGIFRSHCGVPGCCNPGCAVSPLCPMWHPILGWISNHGVGTSCGDLCVKCHPCSTWKPRMCFGASPSRCAARRPRRSGACFGAAPFCGDPGVCRGVPVTWRPGVCVVASRWNGDPGSCGGSRADRPLTAP
jgi:hypothetical protein